MAHRPGVNVHTDGSIDLSFGRVRLEGLYPCVDGSPVRTTAVETFPGGIRLRTEDRQFDLLIDEAPDVARLRLSIVSREGVRTAVRRYADEPSAVVAFNPDPNPRPARLDLPALTGVPGGTAWHWDETGARPAAPQLLIDMPSHSARVFYVSPTGRPPPPGLALGGYLPA